MDPKPSCRQARRRRVSRHTRLRESFSRRFTRGTGRRPLAPRKADGKRKVALFGKGFSVCPGVSEGIKCPLFGVVVALELVATPDMEREAKEETVLDLGKHAFGYMDNMLHARGKGEERGLDFFGPRKIFKQLL